MRVLVGDGNEEEDTEGYHEYNDTDYTHHGHEFKFFHFGNESEGRFQKRYEENKKDLLGEEAI